MLKIGNEVVYVAHFSSAMSDHNEVFFPVDLKNISEGEANYCLSCSAFTSAMLADRNYKLPGDVGLILEVTLDPSPSHANSCCSLGGGLQIRKICCGDCGKLEVDRIVNFECCNWVGTVSIADAQASLDYSSTGSYSEWIIKPPHRVIGVILENMNPRVRDQTMFQGKPPYPLKMTTLSFLDVKSKFPLIPFYLRCYTNGIIALDGKSDDALNKG